MAVVDRFSALITNADASPRVLNLARDDGGHAVEFVGTLETVNGDSANSTYRFCRVPSSMRLSDVQFMNDAITSFTAKIGVLKPLSAGGAVVAAGSDGVLGISASSNAFTSARTSWTSLFLPGQDQAKVTQPLWQLCGLAADPMEMWDVALTVAVGPGAAGTVSARVLGVI